MMRWVRAGVLVIAGLAAPVAFAQTPDPVAQAQTAAKMLDEAALALNEAERAQDRIDALTKTVKAYEAGLVALREGLRRATIREQAITLELEARREEISRLVAVMVTMERSPETLLLLHPSGAVSTARSGMLLGEVTPSMQARAEALRATLEEVKVLRALQESAREKLAEGLSGVQTARTQLSQAVSDRTDLPKRFVADPDKILTLMESADTLDAFASGLTTLDSGEELPPVAGFTTPTGTMPLPVQGSLLRAFNEADAAGIRRPGILVATAPLALVTTPTAATIRYRGPLLDYGNVMILEPTSDRLLVLAGLAQVYGDVGDVLPAGSPVGLMGGADPKLSAFLSNLSEGGGTERTETLYIEVRTDNTPVDPALWFRVKEE